MSVELWNNCLNVAFALSVMHNSPNFKGWQLAEWVCCVYIVLDLHISYTMSKKMYIQIYIYMHMPKNILYNKSPTQPWPRALPPLSFVLPHYGPPSTLEPMYITTLLQRRRHIVGGASRRHGKVRSDEVFIIFWSSSQIFPPHVGNWCRWSIDSLWLFWNVWKFWWTLKTKWYLRWFYQDSKKYPKTHRNFEAQTNFPHLTVVFLGKSHNGRPMRPVFVWALPGRRNFHHEGWLLVSRVLRYKYLKILKIRPGCECTDFGCFPWNSPGMSNPCISELHGLAISPNGPPVDIAKRRLVATSHNCPQLAEDASPRSWGLKSSLSSVCRFSCWRCGRKDIFDLIQYKCIIQMIYCMFAYLRSLLYMSDTLRRWLYLQGTKHRKWFIMLLFPSYQHPPDRTTAARGSGRSDLRGFTHHAFLKSKVLFRKLLGM